MSIRGIPRDTVGKWTICILLECFLVRRLLLVGHLYLAILLCYNNIAKTSNLFAFMNSTALLRNVTAFPPYHQLPHRIFIFVMTDLGTGICMRICDHTTITNQRPLRFSSEQSLRVVTNNPVYQICNKRYSCQ